MIDDLFLDFKASTTFLQDESSLYIKTNRQTNVGKTVFTHNIVMIC